MPKAPSGKLSTTLVDGNANQLPGFSAGAYNADQFSGRMSINSSLLSLFGGANPAAVYQLVPFKYKPIAVFLNVNVVPGTAAATINIGRLADSGNNDILADYSIATNAATGYSDLSANAAFTAADMQAGTTTPAIGDIIVLGTNGNGTTTGKAIFGVIVVPN